MVLSRRIAAVGACLAAISLVATPAAAVEAPRSGPAIYHGDSAHDWGRRYHHRDRIDAGDVLAGVLILGGIAAIAGAANNSKRAERYPAPPPYPQDRQGYRSGTYNYNSDGRGLDSAVDMCVNQVERGQDRVDTVDGANRTADGWVVSGALEGGAGFTCRIDNDGRIRAVDIGGARASADLGEDRQYGDDVYARARSQQGVNGPGTEAPGEDDNRPVWQGDGNLGG